MNYWRQNHDDPVAWICWIGGVVAVGLVVLMARVAVLWVDPAGVAFRATHCERPYKDPRCVQVEDVDGR